MKPKPPTWQPRAALLALAFLGAALAPAQPNNVTPPKSTVELPRRGDAPDTVTLPTLDEVKAAGALRSRFSHHAVASAGSETSQPKLAVFRREIEPILRETCFKCHGAEKQKANFRVDTLNPDLLRGPDVSWWLEVSGVQVDFERATLTGGERLASGGGAAVGGKRAHSAPAVA